VKITITNKKIIFESLDDTMEAKTSFEINTNIEDFTFAVNSKYMIDFLNVLNDEYFTLCLNEPNIPFELKEENFITIVMPLNI